MHVTDVKVTAGTDGFSSVRFLGQGGEAIDVRLADGDGDPVARAKAVMTQVASFDLAQEGERPAGVGGDSSPVEDGNVDVGGEPARGPGGDVWSRPGTRSPLPDRDG